MRSLNVRIGAAFVVPAGRISKKLFFLRPQLRFCLKIGPVRSRNVVQMDADDAVGVAQSQDRAHAGTNVSALSRKAPVSQLVHEPHPQPGDAESIYASAGRPIGKAITRHRWDHHVKRVRGISSIARGVRQHWDNPQHLQERAGPSMSQDQRDRRGAFASLMNEMDSQTLRHIAIVMERRETFYLRFPVKLMSPVLANLLEELETDSVFPSGAGYLVKPAGSTQPVSKVVHRPLRERYRKRFQGHRYCPILASLPSDLQARNLNRLAGRLGRG